MNLKDIKYKKNNLFFLYLISFNILKDMSISLEKSVRTCKVDTGYANKIESARFLDSSQMICPLWNGVDTTGRTVCEYSYWTKKPGCNSASDRVTIENDLRPQYVEYIALSAAGIDGSMYANKMNYTNAETGNKFDRSRNTITGNFGSQFRSSVVPSCGASSYEQALNQEKNKEKQANDLAEQQMSKQNGSGMRMMHQRM